VTQKRGSVCKRTAHIYHTVIPSYPGSDVRDETVGLAFFCGVVRAAMPPFDAPGSKFCFRLRSLAGGLRPRISLAFRTSSRPLYIQRLPKLRLRVAARACRQSQAASFFLALDPCCLRESYIVLWRSRFHSYVCNPSYPRTQVIKNPVRRYFFYLLPFFSLRSRRQL